MHLDDFGESVLADQGLLNPADDVIDAIGRADYFPIPLKAVTFKGVAWGVPFASGFNLLWYRKDLYEKNGLMPPKTWAELHRNVKKLNGNLPDVGQIYGIALPLNNSNATNDTVQNFMWSNGATIMVRPAALAIDSPEALAAYRSRRSSSICAAGSAQYGNLEVLNAFATGKVAHTIYPARMVLQVCAPIPSSLTRWAWSDSQGAEPHGSLCRDDVHQGLGLPQGREEHRARQGIREVPGNRRPRSKWLHSVPVHYWPPRKSTASSPAYNNESGHAVRAGQADGSRDCQRCLPGAQAQLTEAGVVNTQTFKVLQAHVLAKMMQKIVIGDVPEAKAVAEAVAESKQLLAR